MVEEQINCVPISDPRDLTPAIFQMVIYNVFTYIHLLGPNFYNILFRNLEQPKQDSAAGKMEKRFTFA